MLQNLRFSLYRIYEQWDLDINTDRTEHMEIIKRTKPVPYQLRPISNYGD